MLEQQLLRLRRADLLEARRGRQGGYRLRQPAAQISLASILHALESGPIQSIVVASDQQAIPDDASDRVTQVLDQRLLGVVERELSRLSLEDLLFDLHSARARLSDEGGLMLG